MGILRSKSRLAVVAATATLGLVPALLPATSQADTADVTAADGPPYRASITRTEHGIPHVVADDWGSLGFGSGYAAAKTNICTLADVMLTARGQRSRYLGPEAEYDDQVSMNGTNLQSDALVTDLHNRRVVEKLLADPVAGPGEDARAMVRGYAAGVNEYLRDIGGAANISDPACRGAEYIEPNATPTDIWYGVYLANILASTGHFLRQVVEADPPTVSDPGLPLGLLGVPEVDSLVPSPAPVPADRPSAAELRKRLGGELQIGSNATAIGAAESSTGKGMLLGNPHFPWRNRYRFGQQHLTIPGSYDVAGASLIGSPVVNIGWNQDVAWSHTVSTAYRFTPYEYFTAGSPTAYLTETGVRQLEKRVVKVLVKRTDGSIGTVSEDLYRTPQGYVIDDPSTLMGWTPMSFFALRDANAEHLRTIDTFLDMGRATDVHDLLERQDRGGGMPWVNTIAADRSGEVLYADHSVVPNVPNDLAEECMTPIGRVTYQVAGLPGLNGALAESTCAWGSDADAQRPGIFGPENLPVTYRDDWVMNANDSYWLPNPEEKLEGYARIIGCERCARSLRTRMVDRYVMDRLATRETVTPESLRGTQHENRVHGAEVMREDGALLEVCRKADGGDACEVLAAWDGTSNPGSRGNHIFEEFVQRLPDGGPVPLVPGPQVWKVPFDPNDPVNTPRKLNSDSGAVIDAMREAIAHLRADGVPMDATWGSLQVAGDDGVPPIPLGGGLGLTGNANALGSSDPRQNAGFYRPVTFGSSHIQAVSFLPDGKVDARTILTYGQSEDVTSPWADDQTRLFSQQEWVAFPWTPAQIRRQQLSHQVVTGG